MRVVALLVAHELRTRWRSWVVLVLLVALTGGAVMTAAAGARRTSSAYPRYLRASHASDLLVSVAGSGMTGQLLVAGCWLLVKKDVPVWRELASSN